MDISGGEHENNEKTAVYTADQLEAVKNDAFLCDYQMRSHFGPSDASGDYAATSFITLSYVSGKKVENDLDYRKGRWARTDADQAKLSAARLWAKERHPGCEVWVDCCSANLDLGAEMHNWDPLITLGRTFHHAHLTIAVLEGSDAAWMSCVAHALPEPLKSFGLRLLATIQAIPNLDFKEQVDENIYSYWNRAWAVQELSQSRAVVYLGWEAESGTLTEFITSSDLARVSPSSTLDIASYANGSIIGGAAAHRDEQSQSESETYRSLRQWLRRACPPRARLGTKYGYMPEILEQNRSRTYYAIDRRNALLAIATLLQVGGDR